MRDRKRKNFSINFFLAFYMSIELNNNSYSNNYAISILSICDIKCYNIILYLTCQKQKIHLLRAYKVEDIKIFDFFN